jgi:ribosomal protein S18
MNLLINILKEAKNNIRTNPEYAKALLVEAADYNLEDLKSLSTPQRRPKETKVGSPEDRENWRRREDEIIYGPGGNRNKVTELTEDDIVEIDEENGFNYDRAKTKLKRELQKIDYDKLKTLCRFITKEHKNLIHFKNEKTATNEEKMDFLNELRLTQNASLELFSIVQKIIKVLTDSELSVLKK